MGYKSGNPNHWVEHLALRKFTINQFILVDPKGRALFFLRFSSPRSREYVVSLKTKSRWMLDDCTVAAFSERLARVP